MQAEWQYRWEWAEDECRSFLRNSMQTLQLLLPWWSSEFQADDINTRTASVVCMGYSLLPDALVLLVVAQEAVG
jgi:hypothetical protein